MPTWNRTRLVASVLCPALLAAIAPSVPAQAPAPGTLDMSFDPGSGLSGPVNAILVQPDGKVIIGGTFHTFNGTMRPYVARLHGDSTPGSRFLRGDCNDDGNVDLADAVCILDWLFLGGATPGCVAATNTDGVGAEDITDPIYLLLHLFLGGRAPVAPYPACGTGTLPEDEGTCTTPPENCPS